MAKSLKILLILILVILIAVVLGMTIFSILLSPYLPANLSGQKGSTVDPAVVEKVKKSIIAIETFPYGVRSGLVLNEDGLVVALASVLSTKNVFSGYIENDHVSLKNLHMASNNLAFLRIVKSGLANIKFADEAKLKEGQEVFLIVVTSIGQDTWTIRRGTIGQLAGEFVAIDIESNPVFDSSPLFTEDGELVGIVYLDKNGRMLAVPSSKIKALINL